MTCPECGSSFLFSPPVRQKGGQRIIVCRSCRYRWPVSAYQPLPNPRTPMQVITPGHLYRLDMFEQPAPGAVEVQFIHKEPTEKGELVTVSNGTTNEEVIRMLIDRMEFLQERMPCRENAIVLTKLEECLFWLERRTRDREERGVEGKHEA